MYFSGWYQDGARPLAYSRHHLNPRHNPRVLFDFQSEVNVIPLVRCTKKMAGQILNMIFYGDSADENDDEWSRRQDLESTNVPKQNDTIEGKHWFWNKDVWNIFPTMLAQVVGGSYVRSRMHSWLPTGWATKFGPDSLKIPDRWMVWPSLSEILAEKYRRVPTVRHTHLSGRYLGVQPASGCSRQSVSDSPPAHYSSFGLQGTYYT